MILGLVIIIIVRWASPGVTRKSIYSSIYRRTHTHLGHVLNTCLNVNISICNSVCPTVRLPLPLASPVFSLSLYLYLCLYIAWSVYTLRTDHAQCAKMYSKHAKIICQHSHTHTRTYQHSLPPHSRTHSGSATDPERSEPFDMLSPFSDLLSS